jgi:hypothetical protein
MAPLLLGIGAIVHYFSPIKKPEEPDYFPKGMHCIEQ